MATRKRQPKGTRIGGQFASSATPDDVSTDLSLAEQQLDHEREVWFGTRSNRKGRTHGRLMSAGGRWIWETNWRYRPLNIRLSPTTPDKHGSLLPRQAATCGTLGPIVAELLNEQTVSIEDIEHWLDNPVSIGDDVYIWARNEVVSLLIDERVREERKRYYSQSFKYLDDSMLNVWKQLPSKNDEWSTAPPKFWLPSDIGGPGTLQVEHITSVVEDLELRYESCLPDVIAARIGVPKRFFLDMYNKAKRYSKNYSGSMVRIPTPIVLSAYDLKGPAEFRKWMKSMESWAIKRGPEESRLREALSNPEKYYGSLQTLFELALEPNEKQSHAADIVAILLNRKAEHLHHRKARSVHYSALRPMLLKLSITKGKGWTFYLESLPPKIKESFREHPEIAESIQRCVTNALTREQQKTR